MEFSPNQGSSQMDHRGQGYYPADGLYCLGERRERKEYAAEEEHRCDKQGEKVVKAVERGNKGGEEDGNRGEHYTGQK